MNRTFTRGLSFFRKMKIYAAAHKGVALFLIIAVFFTGRFAYGKFSGANEVTRYVLGTVQIGTVIVSVSGTGQVSASNQVDIKPKVSGDIVWVGAKVGQEVGYGEALSTLDDTDARKAVSDAELDIAEGKLQLDKSTAQAPIDYLRKLELLQKTKDDLDTEYKNIFNTVSKAFLDLPSLSTGVSDVMFGKEFDSRGGLWNTSYYRNLFDDKDSDLVGALADIAEKDYKTSRVAYDKCFPDFKSITVASDKALLERLLVETLDTTEALAQAAKSEVNLLDTIVDISNRRNLKVNSQVTSFQSDLKSYLGTANSHVSALSTQINSVKGAKDAITNTERDLSILKINNPTGVKPIDLQISENALQKKESALLDLKKNLSDYVIRAPFAGIVAKVSVKVGDSVSGGTSVFTLITKQKQANISLNEVDAAKISTGDKVTVTLDAVEGLSLTGEVSEIDAVGSVAQGVVSYNVTITFDTQDERVKPGMSVSASIITEVKADALVVPNGALKSQGALSYVEMFKTPVIQADEASGITSSVPPIRQPVSTGLSNDTSTEVTSGLTEGDQIVVRTITSSAKAATQAPSLLSAVGGNRGGGGGNARFVGGGR